MQSRTISDVACLLALIFTIAQSGYARDSSAIQSISSNYPPFIKSLYGFSSTAEPFKSMSIAEIPKWLSEHNINSVFVSPKEKADVLLELSKAGILCLEEFTVFAGRNLYRERPDWRPISPDGTELKPDGWYYGLSPTHPDLRQKRLDEFRNRLANPHIKGIWLDFIRYPVRWEKPNPLRIDTCFSKTSLQQFEQFANIQLPSGSTAEQSRYIFDGYPDEWIDFKVHTIVSWVQEACKIRDAERPDSWIGLFGVPWLPTDFDGAIRSIAGQDFAALAGYIDIFSPMVYHRLCGKTPDWVGLVTQSVKTQTHKPVWPIVQAMNEPGTMSSEEFQKATRAGMKASGNGIILFTANHIENEKRWNDVKKLFHPNQ